MSESYTADDIVDAIDEITEKTMSIKTYLRGIDYNGDYDDHCFIIYGDDTLSEDWILGFAEFIEEYSPDTVDLNTTNSYPHLTLGFNDSRITDAPPDIEDDYGWRTANIHAASGECNRCSKQTPTAYPPILVRWKESDSKWASAEEKQEIDLCVTCSPANYVDVARQIQSFCAEGSTIVAVQYNDDTVIETDDEFDDPYTERVIDFFEKDILPKYTN